MREIRQAIRLIVSVRLRAVADQITVVIPGVGLTIHTGKAIGCIIDVVRYLRRGDGRGLRRAIADGVIGILKRVGHLTSRGRLRQAIQAVVGVGERRAAVGADDDVVRPVVRIGVDARARRQRHIVSAGQRVEMRRGLLRACRPVTEIPLPRIDRAIGTDRLFGEGHGRRLGAGQRRGAARALVGVRRQCDRGRAQGRERMRGILLRAPGGAIAKVLRPRGRGIGRIAELVVGLPKATDLIH